MFFLKELPTRQIIEGYADRFPELNVAAVEDALVMMRRASLLIRELDAYFAARDLSLLRFLILIVIDREPERDALMITEIADRVDVSKPVMTRTLKAMRSDGLIDIKGDAANKRTKQVRMTPLGRRVLNDALPGYYRLIEAFMTEGDA